ncbi:cysteine--tRNA ligase [Candidatus Pacearchaeota archaeon]|nr:cysteine--tRNA ligase [Candidatus Pacearchaeota archaeon]
MAPLKIYNTLTREKEIFKPISEREVKMYSCGPTVYWFAHVGNMRAYIFEDILKRVLLYNNFKVKNIINITDVGHLTSDADQGEDKIEKEAEKENKTAKQISEFYFEAFKKDFLKLNLLEPAKWTRATEHIKEQIELIKKLGKKGYTYQTSDGIYYNSAKFKNYGKLARLNIKELKAGKRIALGEKKNKTDFALWKFSPEPGKRQQEWESPWGVGFPGWHIECSAMSMKYLGETLDIHTGGEDHIPIHHTNEIAQSEAATGKKFVNYWMHVAFLTNKGAKVSKSKGGLFTISELEENNYDALAYRYLVLQTHYRKQLSFSLENLDAAQNAYNRLKRKIIELKKEEHKGNDLTKEYESKFLEAINDDLNMSKALDVFWAVLDDFDFAPQKKLKLLEKFDKVLGLNIKEMKEEKLSIPKEIQDLIKEREKLRQQKKFAEADIIRMQIKEKGYLIDDKSEGPVISKI